MGSKRAAAAPSRKVKKSKKEVEAAEDELNKDKIQLESSDSESESEQVGAASESESESDTEKEVTEKKKSVETKKSVHTIVKPVAGSGSNKPQAKGGKRGVIYIGHLPSGFEEKELRKYFSQFGDITNLRVSRNKVTGNSRHYAFLEFEDADTAKVAADTMNNYLLFSHVLVVSVIPPEKVHEELFVGSNRKYKSVRRSRIVQARHDAPKTQEQWDKLAEDRKKYLEIKQQKLKAAGIDFDLSEVMSVE